MRRDWKVRPAMLNGVSRTRSTAVVTGSPSSYEVYQLDRIARGDAHVAERRAAHDPAVVLDHHGARIERQLGEQLEQGRARRNRPALSVDDDVDGVVHCHASSIRRAAAPGSVASHSARMAAAPYAPAAFTSRARSGVTPPMAITGSSSRAISRSRSRPSGERSGWVAVAYTGPTTR